MAEYYLNSPKPNSVPRLEDLEPSWRPKAIEVLEAIPSTWETYAVKIQINYIFNGGHSSGSLHKKGLAIDLQIILDGHPIGTGNIGTKNKATATFTHAGKTYKLNDLYSTVLGDTAKRHGCRWGGDFRPLPTGQNQYDPMHFDAGLEIAKKFNLRVSEYSDQCVPLDVTIKETAFEYSGDAGYSSKTNTIEPNVDNNTPITSANVENAITYIGYDLTLSDFSNHFSSKSLGDLLKSANVNSDVANKLNEFSGVKGKSAYEKYQKYEGLSITEENANSILAIQVENVTNYLKNNTSIKTEKYPNEISTAIVSYLFGKNLTSEDSKYDIDEFSRILAENPNPAKEIAKFIERRSSTLPADIKARRQREVELLRSYNPYKVDPSGNSLESTGNKDYASEEEALSNQMATQLAEMKDMLRGKKSSDPASSEYDDTFSDISQSTLDAIAALMQSQQVNSDLYFGFKEREYQYRLKTKNFYTIISRALNCKMSDVDKLVDEESMLKDHKDYTLSHMYSMIPYSNGLAYTIKKNAVKRCEFRIRQLEQRIKNNESALIGWGVPSTDNQLEIAAFILTLPLRFGAAVVDSMSSSINDLFKTVGIIREQLKLERGNLAQLRKDMNRYGS